MSNLISKTVDRKAGYLAIARSVARGAIVVRSDGEKPGEAGNR